MSEPGQFVVARRSPGQLRIGLKQDNTSKLLKNITSSRIDEQIIRKIKLNPYKHIKQSSKHFRFDTSTETLQEKQWQPRQENGQEAYAVRHLDNDSSMDEESPKNGGFEGPHLYESTPVKAFVFQKKYSIDQPFGFAHRSSRNRINEQSGSGTLDEYFKIPHQTSQELEGEKKKRANLKDRSKSAINQSSSRALDTVPFTHENANEGRLGTQIERRVQEKNASAIDKSSKHTKKSNLIQLPPLNATPVSSNVFRGKASSKQRIVSPARRCENKVFLL